MQRQQELESSIQQLQQQNDDKSTKIGRLEAENQKLHESAQQFENDGISLKKKLEAAENSNLET